MDDQLASAAELCEGIRRRYQTLRLPLSGKRVRIQSLSERELSDYQAAAIAANGSGLKKARLADATRRLMLLCLVDEAGNRLLNETHLAQLAQWDAADAAFLYERMADHVGLNREELEALVKNCEATPVVE